MTRVTLNIAAISAAAEKAHKDVAIALHIRSLNVISTPGYFDSTPEDIVDTGMLRASQQFPSKEGNAYVLRNNVEYGPYVYFGYTTSTGRRIEGRPWMQAAVNELNPQAFFAERLKEYLG